MCAPSYADKILRVLFSRSELENRIRELSKTISKDYLRRRAALGGGTLKGAFIAVADVARNLTVPNQIDFMVASSYGHGTETSGVIKLKSTVLKKNLYNLDVTSHHSKIQCCCSGLKLQDVHPSITESSIVYSTFVRLIQCLCNKINAFPLQCC